MVSLVFGKDQDKEAVGAEPTTWAISTTTPVPRQQTVAESLYPSSPDDWLIVADVASTRRDPLVAGPAAAAVRR